jgi:hypothetical protein
MCAMLGGSWHRSLHTCGDGQKPGVVRLFDGLSLNGWEGDTAFWRVIDGAIVGGTLKAPVPQSAYLCTRAEFADFELRLSARLTGGPNAGVRFFGVNVSPARTKSRGTKPTLDLPLAGSSQNCPTRFRAAWSSHIHCGVV